MERLFQQYLKRDEFGKSIFDPIIENGIEARAGGIAKRKPYVTSEMNVSKMDQANIKLDEAIHGIDTCKGCVGLCPGCFSFHSPTAKAPLPRAIEWKGKFEEAPDMLRRIGVNGDSSINPDIFFQVEPEYIKAIQTPGITVQDLDRITAPAMNWNYTNQVIRDSGLALMDTGKGTNG